MEVLIYFILFILGIVIGYYSGKARFEQKDKTNWGE